MTNQAFANFERTFDNLQGVGRAWAAYGIDVGRAALETGAERLKATAGYLEVLSQRMDEYKVHLSPTVQQTGDVQTGDVRTGIVESQQP